MSTHHPNGPSGADVAGMRARGIAITPQGYQQYKEQLWSEKMKSEGRLQPDTYSPIVNNILTGHAQGTPFDPAGNPAFSRAMADRWGQMGHDRELAAVHSAQVDAPGDPQAQAFARIKSRIASGSDQAKAFGDYQTNAADQYQGNLWNLLGGAYGNENNMNAGAHDRNFAAWQAERQRKLQQQLAGWQAGGALVGAGIGAFAG